MIEYERCREGTGRDPRKKGEKTLKKGLTTGPGCGRIIKLSSKKAPGRVPEDGGGSLKIEQQLKYERLRKFF